MDKDHSKLRTYTDETTTMTAAMVIDTTLNLCGMCFDNPCTSGSAQRANPTKSTLGQTQILDTILRTAELPKSLLVPGVTRYMSIKAVQAEYMFTLAPSPGSSLPLPSSTSAPCLTTGAKAGIGVGASLWAILLFAGIIALFILRRRKRQ